jgi:hypothetical protein
VPPLDKELFTVLGATVELHRFEIFETGSTKLAIEAANSFESFANEAYGRRDH